MSFIKFFVGDFDHVRNSSYRSQIFFFQFNTQIPVENFQKNAVYFSDYDFAIQAILKFLAKNNARYLAKELFNEKFNKVIEIFNSLEGKSIDDYQSALFNRLTGQDLEKIIKEDEEEKSKASAVVGLVFFERLVGGSFFVRLVSSGPAT